MAEGRKKTPKAEGEVKTVEYLAPGVKPDVQREPFTLDPELEEIRERETEANKVDISGSREEPSIAPELVKLRDEEAERGAKRLGPDLFAREPKKDAEPKSAPAKKSGK
jgi:hypothetical protein